METLNFISKARKLSGVEKQGEFNVGNWTVFVVGTKALIKSGGKENPRYDFVWGSKDKTSVQVARERCKAHLDSLQAA